MILCSCILLDFEFFDELSVLLHIRTIQHMCNVILRRVYEFIFALCVCVGRVGECVLVCVYVCGCTGARVCLRACSLTDPECNAPPSCHLLSLCLCRICLHYLINGTISGGTLLAINVYFDFL
jgi:hypothetical protein